MGAKGSGCSSLNESGNRRTVAGPRQMCRPSRLNFDQRQPCGPRPSPHAYAAAPSPIGAPPDSSPASLSASRSGRSRSNSNPNSNRNFSVVT